MNDAFGCSRATQLRMEDLRLLIYQKYVQVEGVNASRPLLMLWMDENASQQ